MEEISQTSDLDSIAFNRAGSEFQNTHVVACFYSVSLCDGPLTREELGTWNVAAWHVLVRHLASSFGNQNAGINHAAWQR